MPTITLRSGSRAILVNARLSFNAEPPAALAVAKVLPGRENFIKHAAEVPDHGSGPKMMEAALNALQPSRAAVDAGHHHVLTARDSAEPFYEKMGLEHSGHDMYGLPQYTARAGTVARILKDRAPEIKSPHE